VWCSDVFDWPKLFCHEGFKILDMIQEVTRRPGVSLQTTRCPIRIDGSLLKSARGAPILGEHTQQIMEQLSLA
jgi:CoA:oxalate CoA-transferase